MIDGNRSPRAAGSRCQLPDRSRSPPDHCGWTLPGAVIAMAIACCVPSRGPAAAHRTQCCWNRSMARRTSLGPPARRCKSATSSRGPDCQVVLLVGRAGNSHWSLSVLCEPEGRITFDVACRLSQPPAQLGSRYRARSVVAGIDADAELLQLAPAAGTIALAPWGPSSSGGEDVSELSLGPPRASLPPEQSGSRTIQWSYRIQALSAGQKPSAAAP